MPAPKKIVVKKTCRKNIDIKNYSILSSFDKILIVKRAGQDESRSICLEDTIDVLVIY